MVRSTPVPMIYKMNKRLCGSCGYSIADQYYLQVGSKALHSRCLKCHTCQKSLSTENSCYEKKGETYCKMCYYKLFSLPKCMGCHVTISTSDLVMEARKNYYHVDCFRCIFCGHRLEKGNKFGINNQQLFCERHYLDRTIPTKNSSSPEQRETQNPDITSTTSDEKPRFSSLMTRQMSSDSFNPKPLFEQNHPDIVDEHHKSDNEITANKLDVPKIESPVDYVHVGFQNLMQSSNQEHIIDKQLSAFSPATIQATSKRITAPDKISNPASARSSISDAEMTLSVSSGSSAEEEYLGKTEAQMTKRKERKSRSKIGKPKRIRTTFMQSQLLAMKELFDFDKNPSSEALQELSGKINLKKRVLQVWFQNARAKHRKGLSILSSDCLEKSRTSAEEREENIEVAGSLVKSENKNAQICYNTEQSESDANEYELIQKKKNVEFFRKNSSDTSYEYMDLEAS